MQHDSEFKDYYKLLGISPNADTLQIRQAFIHKAKQHHPDIGGSTDLMRLLNLAYKTLTSSNSKPAYDLLHRYYTGEKKVTYKDTKYRSGAKPNSAALTDEYIDWFIDTVYAEFSNINKPKFTFSKLIKKVFNNHI